MVKMSSVFTMRSRRGSHQYLQTTAHYSNAGKRSTRATAPSVLDWMPECGPVNRVFSSFMSVGRSVPTRLGEAAGLKIEITRLHNRR
jgi:hypothetical protein